jgi:hypothetical protein
VVHGIRRRQLRIREPRRTHAGCADLVPLLRHWNHASAGKGWNTILRLYALLQPWFDKSWKPGDFEEVM